MTPFPPLNDSVSSYFGDPKQVQHEKNTASPKGSFQVPGAFWARANVERPPPRDRHANHGHKGPQASQSHLGAFSGLARAASGAFEIDFSWMCWLREEDFTVSQNCSETNQVFASNLILMHNVVSCEP